jgi:hypothetical protein
MLIVGVELFGKAKEDLKETGNILIKYPDLFKVQKLLKAIKNLE